jgi:hypothetical protein
MPWPMPSIATGCIASAMSALAPQSNRPRLLLDLMQQNTHLTMTVKELTERVEVLARDVHASLVKD